MTQVVWVTGAAGFIGSHVARRFRSAEYRVVEIGRGAKDYDCTIDERVLDLALQEHGIPFAVYHAAGVGTVGHAEAEPKGAYRDILSATSALRAVLERWAPRARVIYPSSAAVYGAVDSPMKEDGARNPQSLYGQLKARAEGILLESQLPVICFRLFSVYGRGLRKQLPWELGQKLWRAATDGHEVSLSGTGFEQRDFIHVDDVADAAVLAARGKVERLTCNLGTGYATPIAEVAATMRRCLGVRQVVNFTRETRPGDPVALVADTGLQRAHGFHPAVPLHEGLPDYCRWLRAVSAAPRPLSTEAPLQPAQ